MTAILNSFDSFRKRRLAIHVGEIEIERCIVCLLNPALAYLQEPLPTSSRLAPSPSWETFETESRDNPIGENNVEEIEESSSAATKECGICGDAWLDYRFVAATYDCQHEINYCTLCLQSWISSSLESRGWDNIRCPESDCGAKLEVENIQQHADRETFEK
jgi:hypothetical protein